MLLYISRDQRRPQVGQLKVFCFAPIEKLRDGVGVSGAGVFVADVGREEFNKTPDRFLAGTRNRCRKPVKTGTGQLALRNWDDGEGQTS